MIKFYIMLLINFVWSAIILNQFDTGIVNALDFDVWRNYVHMSLGLLMLFNFMVFVLSAIWQEFVKWYNKHDNDSRSS